MSQESIIEANGAHIRAQDKRIMELEAQVKKLEAQIKEDHLRYCIYSEYICQDDLDAIRRHYERNGEQWVLFDDPHCVNTDDEDDKPSSQESAASGDVMEPLPVPKKQEISPAGTKEITPAEAEAMAAAHAEKLADIALGK